MDWQGEWIWGGDQASPRNAWRCFRREFAVAAESWDRAQIAITADSRYVLWLNGHLVGRGPVRSWPSAQAYDSYEVEHLLRADGENVIAVLVRYFGVSTFSYLRGRGGLLAQFDLLRGDEAVWTLETNSSWQTTLHAGHDSRSPLAFAERIDARLSDDAWLGPGFDDRSWDAASLVGPAGTAPWTTLVPRDIPLLSEEPLRPVRVASLSQVTPVAWTTAIDVRAQMVPDAANHTNVSTYAGYVATIIRVPEAARATLGFPQATTTVFGPCSINGARYDRHQFRGSDPSRYLDVDLHAGDNWLVCDVTGRDHGHGFHLGIDTETPFELISPIAGSGDASPFVAIGPFPADLGGAADATSTGTAPTITVRDDRLFPFSSTVAAAGDLEQLGELVRPIPRSLVSRDNVFVACTWVRERAPHPVPADLQLLGLAEPIEVPRFDERDTELIVDFGRILSGYLELEVEAHAGAVLDFYGFEFLADGERQDTYRADNTLRYTCREGRQRYTSVVRRGMRYLMIVVRGTPGAVRFHELTLRQSNYPVAEVGQFRCADPLLNDIYEISRHTTRVCMEDTFVDCPTYEQTFWVGDARNEALVAYHMFGAEPLVKRCLRLVPGSRVLTPFYCSQVPSGWTNVIPNWTFLWAIACQEYYERTGDDGFAREIWPHVRFTLDHYLECRNKDGLLEISAWNLLDWAPMDQPSEGVVTHQNSFLVKALRATARLADLAGDARGDAYRAAARDLSEAINRHLWSESRGAYFDALHPDGHLSTIFSIQTQVIAYLGGVAEGERAARVEHLLSETPPDFVAVGSPFMSFFHYEVLANLGRFDAMLADMRANYGEMLAHGATTCWEMYANTAINRANPSFLTRSHCHAWSAGPVYFLGAYILGVRPLTPGWADVVVQPAPADLAWARGSVPLPRHGTVDVSWRSDADRRWMELSVRAPREVRLTATLPPGFEGTVDIEAI